MYNFSNLSYGLAWTIGILKFIIQYDLNKKTNAFGLNYIYLIANIGWALCESLYNLLQNRYQDTLTSKISIALIGLCMVWINVKMIRQRREMKKER